MSSSLSHITWDVTDSLLKIRNSTILEFLHVRNISIPENAGAWEWVLFSRAGVRVHLGW